MKKLIALAFVAFFSFSALAQQVDLRKKITVSGLAESEVTPDIIYVSISLKEYFKDNNSKNRIDITTLENQLVRAVQQAGLPKESLTINSLSSFATRDKKKNPEFLASKQYRLKVNDLNRYNDIIGAIDPRGIAYTNIDSYDYSKIDRLKLELKVRALQLAKQKATLMVESIGDKLGSAIDIQEINNEIYPQAYRTNNMMMKASAADQESSAEIDFKQIKLSYTVNVVFEIK
ncbi:hypothetical protein GCM10011387_28580 [Pedobacter quisquiliarum]|uniref:SIMPL domain-containing protein n=1 Tax=Pedobacter quisquiliarum TaxID=1834438 RepID=A0A916UI65_9SPHI|nr:SIMPL domain-containing protein [Pedobacter quisquiliarum]GGC73277.1 hypothetical protein GCM10011387_28580 [Pedobacter quisquiliarum]